VAGQALEFCAGCATPASPGALPYVAVTFEAGRAGAHPVCLDWWKDPGHRKSRIKGHFFVRAQEATALRFAGSQTIGAP